MKGNSNNFQIEEMSIEKTQIPSKRQEDSSWTTKNYIKSSLNRTLELMSCKNNLPGAPEEKEEKKRTKETNSILVT